jgi:hypothetical protein
MIFHDEVGQWLGYRPKFALSTYSRKFPPVAMAGIEDADLVNRDEFDFVLHSLQENWTRVSMRNKTSRLSNR